MSRIVLCVQNLSVPKDPRVWREARDLAAAGHEVHVISPIGPGLVGRERLEGVDIIRHPSAPTWPGLAGFVIETAFSFFWTLAWTLHIRAGGRIAALHAANPPDAFFLVGAILKLLGARYVFDQHDLAPELAEIRWGRGPAVALMWVLERLSYLTADLVVLPNESYRRVALDRGHIPLERTVVVRNGPDRAGREATPPSAGALVVAYAGVINRQDGVEVLVRAAARLESSLPGRFRFRVIGSGDDLGRVRRLAAQLAVEDTIEWTGWLTGEAYRRALHSAHVGVSPDPDDPLARKSTMIKVVEYVAAGMPSVVADLPESRVTAGDAALYFAPGDDAALAARLIEIEADLVLRDRLIHEANRRASDLLWGHSALELRAAYARLLTRPFKSAVGDSVP
jgi:glycosyltransferase involved in cell wall biosynthesis